MTFHPKMLGFYRIFAGELPQEVAHSQHGEVGLSENVGNIPNEIAIFHRDNDQQNHWVFRGFPYIFRQTQVNKRRWRWSFALLAISCWWSSRMSLRRETLSRQRSLVWRSWTRDLTWEKCGRLNGENISDCWKAKNIWKFVGKSDYCWPNHIPIGSMYGMYANIGGILMVNVTICTITWILWDMERLWDNYRMVNVYSGRSAALVIPRARPCQRRWRSGNSGRWVFCPTLQQMWRRWHSWHGAAWKKSEDGASTLW